MLKPPQRCWNEGDVRVLGVNPWIYDFAAYNLWARPMGLLACLDMLGKAGCGVALLDCLDPSSDVCGLTRWPRPRRQGVGHYPKTTMPVPKGLEHVPRRWSRYGVSREGFCASLSRLDPPPDLVLLTSVMTYWYPGVVAAAEAVKSVFPDVPVVLGGVYASLCPDHARSLGAADALITGPLERPENWAALWAVLGETPPPLADRAGFDLASELYPHPLFAPVLGSRGCPFACPYCAGSLLYKGFCAHDPGRIIAAAQAEYDRGVRHFAFYDDALLMGRRLWLCEFLEHAARRMPDVELHTPNAVHARYLTPDICALLRRAGLRRIRLGLETDDFDHRPDGKLSQKQWEAGTRNLLASGFTPDHIGVNLLFGAPGQDYGELERTVKRLRAQGLRVYLSDFSPIPGSSWFEKALAVSPYPLDQDPVFQNKSIWPCHPTGFSWEENNRWKDLLSA